MTAEERADARVEEALSRGGLVSASALAHARAVRRRGYGHTPLGEVLVALEHLAPADLAATLAELSGAPLFDGRAPDPALLAAASEVRSRALPISLERGVLHVATVDPLDPSLGQRLARALKAKTVVLETAEAATLAGLLEPELLRGLIAEMPPVADDADEVALRARWAPDAPARIADVDGPDVRLVNAMFLDLAWTHGSSFRVEAFEDRPALFASSLDRSEVGPTREIDLLGRVSRARLERCIWRLRAMADLPPGPASHVGLVQIHGDRETRSFQCAFERTERGPVATVRERVAWAGMGPPGEAAFDRYYAHLDAAARAEDAEAAADACRAAVAEATRLGPEAFIERIDAYLQLAAWLDALGRSDEAVSFAERALALAHTHELGPRALGDCHMQRGIVEMSDPAARVAALERAEALLGAPGTGRVWVWMIALEIAIAERKRGRFEAARAAAERAIADERLWLGARSTWGAWAHVELALACAALGDVEGAADAAAIAERVGEALALDRYGGLFARGAAEAVAGRHREAVLALEASGAECTRPEDAPYIARALAASLDALGRREDAVAVARRALASPTDAFDTRVRLELEELTRRPPYR